VNDDEVEVSWGIVGVRLEVCSEFIGFLQGLRV
jgi:hypothetical protein